MNNINYDWKKIGERIKQERKEKKLSLENLAEQLGITRQTLSKWEKGEAVEIGIYTLIMLCNIFNCEMGYILCEYDLKTRVKTDIKSEIGLSEKTLEHLAPLKGNGIRLYSPKSNVINALVEFNNGDILDLISDYLNEDFTDVDIRNGGKLKARAVAESYILEISGELRALRKKIKRGVNNGNDN